MAWSSAAMKVVVAGGFLILCCSPTICVSRGAPDSAAAPQSKRDRRAIDECQPDCPTCLNENCTCTKKCRSGCVPNMKGEKCSQVCDCGDTTVSNGCLLTGQCICLKGARNRNGDSNQTCEPCPQDMYGVNCEEQCSCEEGEMCHPEDGCISIMLPGPATTAGCTGEEDCITTQMGAETSSSPMVRIGMTSPANVPPRMCQTDADCSGESCQSGACVAESDSSGDSSKTIIIAVSVTVIVLLLVFVTAILLILRRVHAMPSTTHQTHVHVHSATSAGSYNDLIGKTQDPSKAYTTPRRLQNGVWVSDEPEDYTALERPDEPPTYTPLLKMPSGRPPPMVGTKQKLVTVQDESEENSGAAYAHAQVITQHEEPCYRVLELPPIKDIPPPVAKRQDMSRTLPQNAALGYAQLEKDKPVLQATRSMSVTSLHENKNRTRRSSSQASMATSKSVKASLPSPTANQEAEKTWKLKATQQHEEV